MAAVLPLLSIKCHDPVSCVRYAEMKPLLRSIAGVALPAPEPRPHTGHVRCANTVFTLSYVSLQVAEDDLHRL